MFNRVIVGAFLLIFTSLYAERSLITVAIHAKEDKGYLVLSDGSLWKVSPFVTRWRNFSEWVQGVELMIPETYKCTLNDWIVGNEIEISSKMGHLMSDLSNASNESELRQCTHLFFNTRSEKILFAQPLNWTDGLVQVFDDGYRKGHDEGYDKGKSDGRELGYTEGKLDACRDQNEIADDDSPADEEKDNP